MKNTLLQFIANAPSTNKLLSEMVQNGVQSGTPIPPFFALHTDFQSDGRGMGTNTWFSEPDKNILASFHLQPDLPASRQFVFNQYFALTTLFFIRNYIPDALIKWPNDLYVDGKKIAGILIEHVLRGNSIRYTIAGIGININQNHFPNNIPHPTSLLLETGCEHDVNELLETYWQLLHDRFSECDLSHEEYLKKQYISNLYQFNEFHAYLIHDVQIEARITDIDEYGRLVLQDRNEKEYVCGFKEIQFL